MARRRHHKKKMTHRRRRHSGMGAVSSTMTSTLSVIAGAVAGKLIAKAITKGGTSTTITAKTAAIGQVAVGLFLPKLMKNKFSAGIGTGMIVNGGLTLLSEFNVIKGIGAADYQVEYVSGTDPLSVIAGENEDYMGVTDQGIFSGTDPLSVIAGDFEDMDGGDY